MNTADPQAAPAHGGAGDPSAGGVDPAAFTPEQWQAYQHAFAQATQAQQMYAQAQQTYAQAEQAGQAEAAQQAYGQAAQAQQIYAQAHQTYLAILQQVQAQGPVPQAGHDPAQAAAMQQQAYAQQQQQQAYEQQQAYAQQQAYEQQQQQAAAMQQPQMQQPQMQQPQMQQPQMQQQAPQGFDPQQAQAQMQAQLQAYGQQLQQQGYDPQQIQQAQAQMQQQQMQQMQQMQQQQQQQQMYAQSQQSMQQVGAPVGQDPLASTDWDEAYYDDSALESQGGVPAVVFWVVALSAIIGSMVALYFATQMPPPLKDPYGEGKKEKLTEEQRKKRRAMLLGEDKEVPTKNLRPVSLSMKRKQWTSAVVAGKGDCRTLYFADSSGVYAAEANQPKDEKDYIKQIHPDNPFGLRKLPLPMRTLSRQLITGPGGSFLLLRAQIARQSWMLVYPLVGNPLKGKGSKRGAFCGESGRAPASFLRKRELILLGEGSCSLANDTLGVKPRLCLSGISVPKNSPLWFWQEGRRMSPPKGYLLLGPNLVKVKRRAKARTTDDLYKTWQRSTMPSFDRDKKKWVALEKGSRSIWTFGPRTPSPTGIELPVKTNTALRILVTRKHIRVVFPTRMLKFARSGKSVKRVGIYPFGRNVKVTHATWGINGKVLFLLTKKKTVYQFSENP